MMDPYREKISVLLARLGRKQHPAVRRSPAPQTSLSTNSRVSSLESNANIFDPVFTVFELPDELILSILSHVPPDPRFAGHYAWFRIRYGGEIDDYHQQRAQFLRPLSMTCWAMRLRLVPWVWERLELPLPYSLFVRREIPVFLRKLNAITNGLRADTLLATSVKYLFSLLRP